MSFEINTDAMADACHLLEDSTLRAAQLWNRLFDVSMELERAMSDSGSAVSGVLKRIDDSIEAGVVLNERMEDYVSALARVTQAYNEAELYVTNEARVRLDTSGGIAALLKLSFWKMERERFKGGLLPIRTRVRYIHRSRRGGLFAIGFYVTPVVSRYQPTAIRQLYQSVLRPL